MATVDGLVGWSAHAFTADTTLASEEHGGGGNRYQMERWVQLEAPVGTKLGLLLTNDDIVAAVRTGSLAHEAGLRTGDKLMQVSHQPAGLSVRQTLEMEHRPVRILKVAHPVRPDVRSIVSPQPRKDSVDHAKDPAPPALWYYRLDDGHNEPVGPMSNAEVASEWRAGLINFSTEFWAESWDPSLCSSGWVRLGCHARLDGHEDNGPSLDPSQSAEMRRRARQIETLRATCHGSFGPCAGGGGEGGIDVVVSPSQADPRPPARAEAGRFSTFSRRRTRVGDSPAFDGMTAATAEAPPTEAPAEAPTAAAWQSAPELSQVLGSHQVLGTREEVLACLTLQRGWRRLRKAWCSLGEGGILLASRSASPADGSPCDEDGLSEVPTRLASPRADS